MHPIIGNLYRYRITSQVSVYIVPVEIASRGFYKSAVLCYVFSPGLSADYLYRQARSEDMLIQAVLLAPSDFRNGRYEIVSSSKKIPVPFFDIHVFEDQHGGGFHDINGNKLSSPTGHIAPSRFMGPPGLCEKVSKVLSLDIDCWNLNSSKAASVNHLDDVPSDNIINEDNLLITIQIPHDSDACKDPDQDIMRIEDAVIVAIEPTGFGILDGNGIGETATELFLVINKGKYPQAIKSIRKALEDTGELKYEIQLNNS